MKRGFTIIELLMVVAIIALLVMIVVVSLRDVRAKARDAKRIGDINAYVRILEIYINSVGIYPSATGDISSPDQPDGLYQALVVEKKLLSELMQDPVNSGDYRYHYSSTVGDTYELQFCPETKVLQGYDPGSCPHTISP